ncbi:MAG: aminotransferase class I/II-fold pyridoxal phosphate-dependent enzyme [Anaerofustis stercorihominis]|nr:aminotransferase class I/II-fold pyridoxal phosphate-dependent enzyme [Anaerofustis stercorihominis]
MAINMVANHAIRAREDDIIFGLSARANEAIAKYGKENVINSTIGTLLDDDGKLVAFESVYSELQNMNPADIAAYAGLAGIPAFLDAVVKACFMDHRPEGFIRAVATPGGTGAIKNAVVNYTNPGDTFFTASSYWPAYTTIAAENGRNFDTFNLFNEKGTFDFESYKEKFVYYLEKQKRVLAVINTPAHNPTGYTVSDEEWDMIIDLAKEYAAKDPDYRISILVDMAYIDFAGEGDTRTFMEKFGNLPENIMGLFAYSASKGYTMYGLRNGALICVTSNEDLATEFYYSCAHSNRGNWSNGTKGAMQVIANIFADEEKYAKCEEERTKYRKLLATRGAAFMQGVKEVDLPITNYCGGFFVSVLANDPTALCEKLIEKNVFTVPLAEGIRVAICAMKESDCRRLPAIIKEAMNELGM